ncbi:MAG: SdiA-regulated domain-containing protein [Planctomycetia bacterium]
MSRVSVPESLEHRELLSVTSVDLSSYVRVGRYDLPEPTRTTPPANSLLAQEASAVTYNWDTDTLFVVGDGGTSVVQVSKTGQLIDSMTLATGSSPQGTEFYDTEGISYIGSGKFVLTEERYRQANLFTYAASGTLRRTDVQTVKLGTTIGNIGIEGISYDPMTTGYIAVKEKDPQSIFQTTINFAAGTASNGSSTATGATNLFSPALASLADFSDVFALSNLPSLSGETDYSHLLVISQESGQIINVDRNGAVSSRLTIVADPGSLLTVPDMTMEGITMDRDGVLYVVNENGGGDANHPQLWVYAHSNSTNMAPTAVTLINAVTSIPENTSTAAQVKLADISITDDGLGMNNLSLTGADAASFQIIGAALYLKSGTPLNSTTKPSYNVTVNVDDPAVGTTPDVSVGYTLAITAATGGTASLIISEVAPWASGNSSFAADWFEVTNVGTAAQNIAGWKMDDNSNSFGSSVALTGITSIAPGESVIFHEGASTRANEFKTLWFGTNSPANLQIGRYSGSGVGLSTTGDAVNLYSSAGVLQANVVFGVSPAGPFKTFDNAVGLNNATISNLSAVGINGGFTATNDATEIGSPGTIGAPPAPVVSITATDANAAETGIDPGTFRISRTGSTVNALTVNYIIATGPGQATSADYSPALTGVATIPAGQTFVDISITPIPDYLVEGTEAVSITLGDTGSYDVGTPKTATVSIADRTTGTATGPSSSASPYVLPVGSSDTTVDITSILSVGDTVNFKPDGVTPYRMVGIPDGLGAFDNGNGTFTLLMSHELGSDKGAVRAHGAIGAFVSKWIVSKNDLSVIAGSDLMQQVYGWNAISQQSNTTTSTVAFNRFCSGDLPEISAFYNAASGLGTQERIYMHGEEGGANGYQLATVATGPDAGKTYVLGKFNLTTNGSGLTAVGGWENALANPFPQNKTVVIGNNDGGTGIMSNSVAVYVGTKTNTGSAVDRAGLTNGTLKFVNVTGNTAEIANTTTRVTNIANGTRFTLSGTASTTFSRPEDGAWNPLDPKQFYFVTTDRLDTVSDGLGTQIGQTRLWRLTFDDITNPDAGGKIDLLIDGRTVAGQKVNMFDNLTVNATTGNILLQEDVGGAAHNGKMWEFNPTTNSLVQIAKHDPARFGDVNLAATSPFNNDEESSGIIDVSSILGTGSYLFVDQAHYATSTELVEGGQLLMMRIRHASVAQASLVTATEDTPKSFAVSDFLFTDLEGSSLVSITVNGLSLAAGDTLMVNQGSGNVTVTDGLTITAAQIASLTYTPSPNGNGLARSFFGFKVNDADYGVVTATMTINVAEANDAPTGTNDILSSMLKNSGQQPISFASLLSNDSRGPGNESSQTLTITNVGSAVGGTVAVSGTNVLFTPALNFFGMASFVYTLQDNGTTSGANDFRTSTATAYFLVRDPGSTAGTATGPSSSASPYVLPVGSSDTTVDITSILSVGDTVNFKPDGVTPYRMVGIPDGLGAFDNGNGTFTLLMSHELGSDKGAVRAHGAIGAFVSKWIVSKNDLSVIAGSDLMQQVYGWNAISQQSNTTTSTVAFNRFCSGDLPEISAFYNAASGLGTQERIYMHGEEGGANGYQLATVATGPDAGKTYVLGKFNLTTNGSGLTAVGGWENALANPFPQNKTVVIGNNDGGTGIMSNSVAVYVGTKTNTGSAVDRAGLTNGTLKFVNVTGNTAEIANTTTRVTNIANGTRFTLSGTASTTFSRPEDGAWNPLDPKQFYFVTTDRLDTVSDGLGTQIGQTRLWRLTFDDITNPDAGGKIDLLIDGRTVAGQKVNMFDNLTVNATTGNILLQEDVGGAAHNGKMWEFNPTTNSLVQIAKHDPARFGDVNLAATSPFNNDEESSGIIDVSSILGTGSYLFVDQAHYATSTELVEGGQLLMMRINHAPNDISLSGSSVAENAAGATIGTVTVTDPDPGNTHSLSVNDSRFEIVAGQLKLKTGQSLNYELTPTVTLEIRARDAAGLEFAKSFTISVTNVTELNGIDVQNGQTQRSWIQSLDVLFDRSNDLMTMINNGRLQLTKRDLDGLNPAVTAIPSLSVAGNNIRLNFGTQGLGGNRNTNAGDGYYELGVDMDGNGSFETKQYFYRLLGDVNGDRKVDNTDSNLTLSAFGTTNPERDVNGDGFVNTNDRTLVLRAIGKKLKDDLFLND